MQSNAKYTAKEILEAAGVNVEETVGKMRVRIGGIPVNTPDHLIGVPAEVKKLEIIIGNEVQDLELDGAAEEQIHSEEAQRVKSEIKGKASTEAAEALQAAKAEAAKEAEAKPEE